MTQSDQPTAEKIVKPASRGDQYLRPFADGLQLRLFAQAADHDSRADAGAGGHSCKRFVDLKRQLAGGAQDHGMDPSASALGSQRLNYRQDESECLAGSGLCGGNAVATRFCPASAGSMAIDWIGVGTVNPCRARLLFNSGDSESSEKVFIVQVVRKENQRTDHRLRKKGSRLDFV